MVTTPPPDSELIWSKITSMKRNIEISQNKKTVKIVGIRSSGSTEKQVPGFPAVVTNFWMTKGNIYVVKFKIEKMNGYSFYLGIFATSEENVTDWLGV